MRAPQTTDLALLDLLLNDQQTLTAVERFAQIHSRQERPLQEKYYRDLIPLTTPLPGQQYGFEVDLDACTGCKACVTACHTLNGLDKNETWRSVGLIHSQAHNLPLFHMVTTACHHCAHPACMDGCPVKAYEKDAVTGIVKHLDDQCIGCQYCVLKCPYDVPQYSPERGIVRKCDMCSSRLQVNEAPACVQACPNAAIKIVVVDVAKIIEKTNQNCFLPGTPAANYTHPTTQYKSKQKLNLNMVAADAHHVAPAHSHMPLVFMLVLTQMAVGISAVNALLPLAALRDQMPDVHKVLGALALGIGVAGLNCALLHLGRPLYAFRAFLGYKTSWLSREIIAFSLFLGAASAYAGSLFLPLSVTASVQNALSASSAGAGILGVFCSMMIYIDTRREFWSAPFTVIKFGLSTVLLGAAGSLAAIAVLAHSGSAAGAALMKFAEPFAAAFLLASLIKLVSEMSVLSNTSESTFMPLEKSAIIMLQHSGVATSLRFICGFSACVLALILVANKTNAEFGMPLAISLAALALAGELLERYLYFRAVVALKMPGSVM